MNRRFAPLVGIMTGLALAPAASADPGAGACAFSAAVKLSSDLRSARYAPGNFEATVDGTLSQCEGSVAETGARFLSGKNVTINGVVYRAPSTPAAAGTCQSWAISSPAQAIVQWDGDANLSLYTYSVTVLGPIAVVDGTFSAGSMTLQRVVPDPLDPNHRTDSFTLSYGGQQVTGVAAAVLGDPTLCATAGTKDATLTGVLARAAKP